MTLAQTLTVIIPAHDEATSLPRLLGPLVGGGLPEAWRVLVVCNGCTDESAEVARRFAGVEVAEIAEASKGAALAEGVRLAAPGPHAYVDADVVISQASLRLLLASVGAGAVADVLAAAPARRLDRTGVARLVAWYYDVWELLPQVREGLFGRGVLVVSPAGQERLAALPKMMSDDLLVSESFARSERAVVEAATVTIRLPRTVRDLLRRRVRVATGNAQMDGQQLRSPTSRTSLGALLRLARRRPDRLPKIGVFLVITVIARAQARRRVKAGDFSTWLRDESSRA